VSTEKDGETELEVLVFQGEDANVAGNEFLGAVKVSGLPSGPRGAVQVAITLELDAGTPREVTVMTVGPEGRVTVDLGADAARVRRICHPHQMV
jgi:molecular chaperone DnaK (HSP70)